MMLHDVLMPVVDCWVSQPLPSGSRKRIGAVKSVPREGTTVQVSWVHPREEESAVDVRQLGSGFHNGMEVLDATPGCGVQSLGVGTVMQQRILAGSAQVLVDFPERGERRWLPFQHLRRVRGTAERFQLGLNQPAGEAERLRLRLLAQAIDSWNQSTGALSQLEIDPLPHQIHLVHRILASGHRNWLIADDVGLGKTIETGMLLHALTQRDQARRILLITPAGLTRQWQEELYYKFGLEAFRVYGEDFHIHQPREWKQYDQVIASLDRLKREEHLGSLLQAGKWDLIIFDEAHRLSRRQYGQQLTSSERYELARALRAQTEHLLLLTATPHQGMQDKFIALLELLRPEWRAQLRDLSLNPEILGEMVCRNHKEDVTDAWGQFIFQGKHTRAMQVPTSEASRAFDCTLQQYLRQGYAAGERQGRQGQAIGFVMTVYRKLAASSAAAIHQALCRRLQRLQQHAAGLPESATAGPDDARYRGEWEELCSGSTPGREFFAGEIRLLQALIDEAARLKAEDAKLQLFTEEVLGKILATNPGEKVLIFTEYRATQSYLQARLGQHFGPARVELINGSMGHQQRREAIARFEDGGQFLISTEAGGEGINLQRHCHLMVNYDLPWNPMRLVQRIGRLYRYGQKKKVVVFNIHQPDTLDQQIIGLLYQRIDSVVSDMAAVQKAEFNDGLKDEILGELAELVEVEDILAAATVQGVERTKARIDEALQQARTATAKQRELFAHASSGEGPGLQDALDITPAHLYSFVLGMFRQQGIELIESSHKGRLLRIRLPEALMQQRGLPPRASARLEVTLDRVLAANRPGTQMLDMNHWLMRHLLDTARSHDFGGQGAALSAENLGEGAVVGALLRWQNRQGQPLHQAFVMAAVDAGGVRLNTSALHQWLLRPAASREGAPCREHSAALHQQAEMALEQQLAQQSTLHLLPASLQWVGVGWTPASVGAQ